MSGLSLTVLILQSGVGVVFLVSGASKALHPLQFAQGLQHYGISRTEIAVPLAISFVLLELFLAVSHITGLWMRLAAPLGWGTLLTTGIVVVVALRRGSTAPCLCFGNSTETVSSRTLLRVVVVLLAESVVAGLQSMRSDWPTIQVLEPTVALHVLISAVMGAILVSWSLTAFEMLRRV